MAVTARRDGRHAGTKRYSWVDGVATLVLVLGLNLLIWGSFPLPGWVLVIVAITRLIGIAAYRTFDRSRQARRLQRFLLENAKTVTTAVQHSSQADSRAPAPRRPRSRTGAHVRHGRSPMVRAF